MFGLEQFISGQFSAEQFVQAGTQGVAASQFVSPQFDAEQFGLEQFVRATQQGGGLANQFPDWQFGTGQFEMLQFFRGPANPPIPPIPPKPPVQAFGGGGGMPSSWLRLQKDREELLAKAALRERILQEDQEFLDIILILSTLRLH